MSMDAWARQRSLARTTVVWSVASLAVGTVFATRRDPWWRSFGQQHVGWGLVDLGIVAAVNGYQTHRMRALPDPYAPEPLERQRRHLRAILAANAVADLGYCVLGAVMARRMRDRPKAAGAGAAIVVQGAFLLLHDGHHALALRPDPPSDG